MKNYTLHYYNKKINYIKASIKTDGFDFALNRENVYFLVFCQLFCLKKKIFFLSNKYIFLLKVIKKIVWKSMHKKSPLSWHIAEKYVLRNYTTKKKKKKKKVLIDSVVVTLAKVSKTYNAIKMSEIRIVTWVVFALKHLNEFVFLFLSWRA